MWDMPNSFRPAAGTLTLIGMTLALGAPQTLAQTPASAVTSPATTAPVAPSPSAAPPSAIATPANPPENPLVTTRVRQEFLAWQRGRIDRKTYSPPAGGTYIDALVNVVSPDLTAIGQVQSVQYRTASFLLGDLVYRYDVTGASGVVSVLYWLDARGKTDGIVFTPQIFRSATVSP
jgi:hypothetical protein